MSTRDPSAEGWLRPEEIETHDRHMRGLARSLLIDREAGDDVVQDAWLAFLRRPPRRREAVVSWLRRVVGNLARRERRDASTRLRHEKAAARPEGRSEDPEALLEWIELQRHLQELIGALEEPARTAVVLRFFGELSPAEIARRQGVAVSTVRLRILTGVERLRRGLDPLYREGRRGWRGALLPILGSEGIRSVQAAAGTSVAKAEALSRLWVVGGMTVTKNTVVGAALGCCLLIGGGLYLVHRSSGGSSDGDGGRFMALARENARLQTERDDLVRRLESLSGENRRLAALLPNEAARRPGPGEPKAQAAETAKSPAADAGKAAPENADPDTVKGGPKWMRLRDLFSANRELLAMVLEEKVDMNDSRSVAKLMAFMGDIAGFSREARSISRYPFFDSAVLPELTKALYGGVLGWNEEQLGELARLTGGLLEESRGEFDPAAATPLERLRAKNELIERLASSAESIVPQDGREDWKRYGTVARLALRGTTREKTYPVDDLEAARESILATWKTDYRLADGQSDAATGIVADFVQRANAAWERHAPQDPRDGMAADALRNELLDLQIEAEKKIVSLVPPEERERLADLEPLLIRFKATGKAQGTMSGFPGFSY